jgi:coenzyme F420-reducing hydrogenase beta subunit
VIDLSINAESTYDCTGCAVCKVICPINDCISIDLDSDGYYIAKSNIETCINCNKCQSVCFKFQDKFDLEYGTPLEVYIATNNNSSIHYNSSSGGIATALLSTAIELGYTVIGAEFNYQKLKVEHVHINNIDDLNRIRGSKYLPSYTFDAFSTIEKNKKYAIVGTPCQIGGLKKFMLNKKGYEDLLLIDFRCFGHPGYNLFDKYHTYINNTVNSSGIKNINMRSKIKNWHMWGINIIFNDGTTYFKDKFKDLFAISFRTGQTVHDVCLTCDLYKNNTHADIRLEDAWAFVTQQEGDILKKGLSQIGIFSQKGLEFFNSTKKNLTFEKVDFNYENATWTKVEKDHEFMEGLRKNDEKLESIIRRYWLNHPKKLGIWYVKYFWSSNLYKHIKLFIPKPLKKILLSHFIKNNLKS